MNVIDPSKMTLSWDCISVVDVQLCLYIRSNYIEIKYRIANSQKLDDGNMSAMVTQMARYYKLSANISLTFHIR